MKLVIKSRIDLKKLRFMTTDKYSNSCIDSNTYRFFNSNGFTYLTHSNKAKFVFKPQSLGINVLGCKDALTSYYFDNIDIRNTVFILDIKTANSCLRLIDVYNSPRMILNNLEIKKEIGGKVSIFGLSGRTAEASVVINGLSLKYKTDIESKPESNSGLGGITLLSSEAFIGELKINRLNDYCNGLLAIVQGGKVENLSFLDKYTGSFSNNFYFIMHATKVTIADFNNLKEIKFHIAKDSKLHKVLLLRLSKMDTYLFSDCIINELYIPLISLEKFISLHTDKQVKIHRLFVERSGSSEIKSYASGNLGIDNIIYI